MAHIITAPCYGCRYTDCLVVCPCESFREGEKMLYIDPDSCIDCFACAPECPTSAIYQDVEVPANMKEFIALNAEMSRVSPVITDKRAPLATRQ